MGYKLTGSKFWLLGAAYWIVIAALLWIVVQVWPHLQESQPFFYATVLGAVVGGFAVVYLFQSKS
jgi:uncharacterized membrane-anchored protein YitT (DUF2179 family)